MRRWFIARGKKMTLFGRRVRLDQLEADFSPTSGYLSRNIG